MQDLLKRLKSLGLNFEKPAEIINKNEKIFCLDEVFKGEWIYANDRKLFLIEKVYPYGKILNSIRLIKPELSCNLYQLFRLDENPWKSSEDFIFLDTETSSLSIGAGSFIFMIGLCYFTKIGLKIEQLILPDIIHEPILLNYLDKITSKFSTVVTYNGKSFDVPIIKSRCLINGISTSIDQLIHLDLLHLSRSIWKLRLERRKLSDIENKILGIIRTDEEIPGWLVPQMYFDYLESGNGGILKGVAYHNEMDVISLAILFNRINIFSSDNFKNLGNEDKLDVLSIGEILRKGKNYKLAEKVFEIGDIERAIDSIPKEYIRKYANILKRNGNWKKAVYFWEIAADSGDIPSCIEISKYYEHKTADYNKASIFSQKALEFACIEGKSENFIVTLQHRIDRIKKKTEINNE